MTSLTLAQKRALDLCNEELVVAAEKLLDASELHKVPKNDFGDSQMRNLLAVANETEAPAVVLNFVRYQMGRDSKKKSWRRQPKEGECLGNRLLEELETGAVDKALQQAGLPAEPRLRQVAKMRLIRQYLGFASRYLKYLDLHRSKKNSSAQGGN